MKIRMPAQNQYFATKSKDAADVDSYQIHPHKHS